MPRSLVVKVTCGVEDAERANQGLTVAAAAVALGADVELWLTGEGVWFGTTDRCPDPGLAGATPPADLVGVVTAAGVSDGDRVRVCSQCATRRGLTDVDLAPGVVIMGAASFAESVLRDGVQALVY